MQLKLTKIEAGLLFMFLYSTLKPKEWEKISEEKYGRIIKFKPDGIELITNIIERLHNELELSNDKNRASYIK